MASDCNPTINSNDSSSSFQQTVCLQDWWLIKSEKAFQGKRLAVAGFSSKEQRAVRVFSSAPIIKRYDVFTLETADGITVIIKGFINKLRTNENGFPSEVFNHFLFGFPPHWEKYAEKYFEADSASGFVSRKTPNQCEKTINEARHENCEDVAEMNLGLESSGNLKEQSKIHHDACNESPNMVGKECQQNSVTDSVIRGQEELSFDIGSLVFSTIMVEKDSSENVGQPGSLQNPCGISSSSVCGVGLEVKEREDSLMARVDGNSKPLQPYDCTNDTLKHPTLMSGSEVNTATPCKIGMDRLCTPSNTGSRTCNLKNLKGKQKDNLASNCNVKHKNNERSSPFEECENQGEGNMNRSSLATSAQSGKKMVISEEIPCQSYGEVGVSTSLRKANQKADLETAVEKTSSSGKKTKRKLDYNIQVTHPSIKKEKKASIVSPELLSLKRSRSGRLLLPSLDFWRNQMAVYDADRRITGIQEGLPAVKPSRGSRSEPQRKKRPLK